jgi:hypothetical protein
VPFTLAACAPALAKINPQENAAARKLFRLISCRYPSVITLEWINQSGSVS